MTLPRVGFLHLGDERHGVRRYGFLLARELERQGGPVLEAATELGGSWSADARRLDEAAARLAGADVIHAQYNRALWGDGWYQVRALKRFLSRVDAPVVFGLHDVYVDDPWDEWRRRRQTLRRRIARAVSTRIPARRALAVLLRRADAVTVCFDCERDRLATLGTAKARVDVIGHFIESRPPLPPRDDARRALGVEHRRVVTLLGFIHRRKGPDLLVDALAHLQDDVLVVLAGAPSPGNDKLVRKLTRQAVDRGAADRFVVTGYLDEDEQARWLAATDVAACPFRFLSASGSIATWISAGRPVLCHAVPQVEEYRRIAPDALSSFEPYTAEALAAAITRELGRDRRLPDPSVEALREEFSIERTVGRHVELYRALS